MTRGQKRAREHTRFRAVVLAREGKTAPQIAEACVRDRGSGRLTPFSSLRFVALTPPPTARRTGGGEEEDGEGERDSAAHHLD